MQGLKKNDTSWSEQGPCRKNLTQSVINLETSKQSEKKLSTSVVSRGLAVSKNPQSGTHLTHPPQSMQGENNLKESVMNRGLEIGKNPQSGKNLLHPPQSEKKLW